MGLVLTFHFLKFNGTRAWGEFPPCLEAAVSSAAGMSLPGLYCEQ